MTPDSGSGRAAARLPHVLPLMLSPPSSLSPPPVTPPPPASSPCPSLHTPLIKKSPCVGQAAASATHLLPATNWSDAAEVVAVSALQSCLSLPRQQGEEGCGEGGEERVTVGRRREVVDSDKDEHGTQ